jgi:hypothetical protein
MKTHYIPFKRISLYAVLGLFGVTAVSCGSYQNASKYDADGIYNSTPADNNTYSYNDGQVTQYKDGEVSGQNPNYNSYFKTLQTQYPATALTDVESYSSVNDSVANDTVAYVTNYNANGGWGDNPDNVTVNVYNGGYGWGGWGYPYYAGWYGWGGGWGWGLGWGYGGWYGGWGWNSWYYPSYYYGGWGGWYYPHHHYAYNPRYYHGYRGNSNYYYGGTRSSYYNNTGRYATGRGAAGYRQGTRAAAVNSRRFTNGTTVRSRGDVQYNTGTRNYSNGTRSNSYTPSTRSNSYTPATRSNNTYTPSTRSTPTRSSSTISTPRSSGGSFGGGSRGGGGGGGSRGGGGGRRG